jgi:hypothetical protein
MKKKTAISEDLGVVQVVKLTDIGDGVRRGLWPPGGAHFSVSCKNPVI